MAALATAAMAALGGTAAAGAGAAAAGIGLAAIPGLGVAAGTGIGTAAAATAAAGTASTLAILSGVANAISAVGAIGSGIVTAKTLNDKADETELQIGQDRVASASRQLSIRRELVSILGENDVAFAAAGIDISSGIATSSRASAEKQASSDLSIERADDDMRRALLRTRIRGYRRQGGAAIGGGLLKAAGIGINTGIDIMERG